MKPPLGHASRVTAPPRPWDASQGSLRNFTGKTQEEVSAVPNAVLPPLVHLSGLSQAPLAMHRRRFPFSATSDVWKERKLRGR